MDGMERTELRPAEADLPFVQLAFANEIERGEPSVARLRWTQDAIDIRVIDPLAPAQVRVRCAAGQITEQHGSIAGHLVPRGCLSEDVEDTPLAKR